MRSNKFLILVFAFVFVLSFTSAIYTISNPRLTTGGSFSAFGNNPYDIGFNESMCNQGQDFIVQIDPMGCSPAVVRSDLLEEEPVPIFCKLQAIKVNPILDVEAFRTINLKGEYPPEVRTVGFYPSRSALGENVRLNNLMWDEIGYAVIYLDRQPNESAMPDFVEGNLTAKITYDLKNSFGIRYHSFYLPSLDENEFDEKMGQYSFFDNRGYLRAENVEEDSASIVVYSGRYQAPFGKSRSGEVERQKMGGYDLKIGQETGVIYLPGFGCYSGVKFKLEEIKVEDTRAVLSINSEIYELEKGEKFLDERCSVLNVEKAGINEKTRIKCRTDNGFDLFELNLNPSIVLDVDGEEGEYSVGDYVFTADNGNHVYLAYVNTRGYSDDVEDLVAIFMSTNKITEDRVLTDNDILAAAYYFQGKVGTATQGFQAGVLDAAKNLIDGSSFSYIFQNGEKKGQTDPVEGKKILIEGLGGKENYQMKYDTEEDYVSAIEDFDTIISDYRQEKYPDDSQFTLAEDSLYFKVLLAWRNGQKRDLALFCEEFEESFPYSLRDVYMCKDSLILSNTAVSFIDVLMDEDVKTIELVNVIQPSFEDYGARLVVNWQDDEGNKNSKMMELRKNEIYEIGSEGQDYIRLLEVKDDRVTLEINVKNTNRQRTVQEWFSKQGVLMMDKMERFGTDYTFNLMEVNAKKVAKVGIIPVTKNAGTTAEFEFRVGIEKRAIQLSPEKTQERIEKLDNTISTLENITEGMEKVVEGLKTACIGTGAVLTAKNLVFGSNGESIARQEAMRGEGGWYEKCADLRYGGKEYTSVDSCILGNSDLIDKEVDQILEVMTSQNSNIKSTQENYLIDTNSPLSEKSVNTSAFIGSYSEKVRKKLKSYFPDPLLEKGTVKVNVDSVLEVLDLGGYEARLYSLEELKEIELYADLYSEEGLGKDSSSYKDRLITILYQIDRNAKDYRLRENSRKKSEELGLGVMTAQIGIPEKSINVAYGGVITKEGNSLGLESGQPIQNIVYRSEEYYVTLESGSKSNEYWIKEVYDEKGEVSEDASIIKSAFGKFIKYDSSAYRNPYLTSPEVRYYETEPYKGMPAVVPFDVQNGWYAYVKQTTSALGNIASYQDSEKINSFYLCNIGENRLEDYSQGREKDDICIMVNLNTGQPLDQFPGDLEKNKESRIIKDAIKAIRDASSAHRAGAKTAIILDTTFSVGSPAVNSLSTQCQDVMSPKDCQILFNVCDPVLCPQSRCDFGGKYPVKDVIQSGIVGSVALCLPNFAGAGGDVYMPVCLTGVNEGLKGFTSTLQAYEDCLDESLRTGQTTGSCDELHSVYLCSFFWEQAVPLAKYAVPKLIGRISGEGTRGGGEYLNIQAAFENAKESINFFTQKYAVNSFNAFKARSQEQVGSAFCKNFISLSYPEGQGFLDVLTESDSPPQFNGNFDAIPFTTVTNPPMDHYKVYFHIYAGTDRGAYYKVYLRGGGETSYYSDTFSGRNVASGYISAGDYESQTVDFRAPSGYTEMCIVVNNYEECGFKEVTTSFAKDYVKDQYIQNQINNTQIRSESECISGTASVYSLLNPNLQEGVGDILDPAIYNRGVIRICSTENPGKGSDPFYPSENQRWIEVGECDGTMKCWIDTQSVENSLEFETSKDESLESLSEHMISQFEESEGFINPQGFDSNLTSVLEEEDLNKRIELITSLISKVYRNNQKAKLFLERGKAWKTISEKKYEDELRKSGKSSLITGDPLLPGEATGGSVYSEDSIGVNVETLTPFDQFFKRQNDFNILYFVSGQINSGGTLQLKLSLEESGNSYAANWEGSKSGLSGWHDLSSPILGLKKGSVLVANNLRSRNGGDAISATKNLLGNVDKFDEDHRTNGETTVTNLENYDGQNFGSTYIYYADEEFRFYYGALREFIEFRFESGGWWWKYKTEKDESWRDMNRKVLVPAENNFPEWAKKAIADLEDRNKYEGAAILFNIENYGKFLESGAKTITTYDGEKSVDDLCENICEGETHILVNGKYDSEAEECKYEKKPCVDKCEDNSCEILEACPDKCSENEEGYILINGELNENDGECSWDKVKCVGECDSGENICELEVLCPDECVNDFNINLGFQEGSTCSWIGYKCDVDFPCDSEKNTCKIMDPCPDIYSESSFPPKVFVNGRLNSQGICERDEFNCEKSGGYCEDENICPDACLSDFSIGTNGKYNVNEEICEYDVEASQECMMGEDVMYASINQMVGVDSCTEIPQRYREAYKKLEDEFNQEAYTSLPFGVEFLEFKSLLIAISQEASGIGSLSTGTDWLMGWGSVKGTEAQLVSMADFLSSVFEGSVSAYEDCFNLPTSSEIDLCILKEFKNENYAKEVIDYRNKWLSCLKGESFGNSEYEYSASGIDVEPIPSEGNNNDNNVEVGSSICGEDILEWAESKIGGDTFRIESGTEVYTNPCATFVSNVLIEVGAYPTYSECSIDTIPYRDAVKELNDEFSQYSDYQEISSSEWEDDLKPGDIVMFKNYGRTTVYMDFQHVTIFSKYNSDGGFETIHDGGSSSKIARKDYSSNVYTSSGVPHIATVWRYVGEGCSDSEESSSSVSSTPSREEIASGFSNIGSSSSTSSVSSEDSWTLGTAHEKSKDFSGVTYEGDESFATFLDQTYYRDSVINGVEYYFFIRDSGTVRDSSDLVVLLEYFYERNGARYDKSKLDSLKDSDFSNNEWKIISNSDSVCDDCGSGLFNGCNRGECVAIGAYKEDLKCVYEGRKCVSGGTFSLNTANSNEVRVEDLFLAIREGDLEAVKKLVEEGVDLEAKDYLEKTALMWASEKDNLNVVKYLVENGADVNAKESTGGDTVLMWACEPEISLEIVQYLVDNGADVNVRRTDGLTALITASYAGSLEVVQYLVDNGADVNAVWRWDDSNEDGQTALDLAIEENHPEIADYLKSVGA